MDLSADTSVTVTLTAGEWSTVLYGLDEMPRKQAHIPYSAIQKAMLDAATPQVEEVEVEKPKPNGKSSKKKADIEAE